MTKQTMTIKELKDILSDYDEEMEVKVQNAYCEVYNFTDHVWQWDDTKEPAVLNTYLTINIRKSNNN